MARARVKITTFRVENDKSTKFSVRLVVGWEKIAVFALFAYILPKKVHVSSPHNINRNGKLLFPTLGEEIAIYRPLNFFIYLPFQ